MDVKGICATCGQSFENYRGPKKRAAAGTFCSLKCMNASHIGKGNPNWKGERVEGHGYIKVYRPEHREADEEGYVSEHRLVAALALGRDLLPGEVVHHNNGERDDNRPENLTVFASQSEHMAHHMRERTI